ncbi:hypothetical protein WJX73_007840 [Symbiochloris irregularis]|uniref:BZIP domain-containing protein n=1 Tax=Symbiochloris irregularis TaxID=706552 RepID=A0AAW1PX70_9CHLO
MSLDRQSTLSRQTAAVFDQTIDELQTYVGPGKPVGSMNLEEFLHTFWDKGSKLHSSWDRDHEFHVPADICSPSTGREHNSFQSAASLQSVPEDLRGMSVEEVWHHISERNSGGNFREAGTQGSRGNAPVRSSSNLGQVKISNFLQSVGMEVAAQQASSPSPSHQQQQQQQQGAPGPAAYTIPAPVPMQPLPNPPQLQVRVAPGQELGQLKGEEEQCGPSGHVQQHYQHQARSHTEPQPSTPETPQRRKMRSPPPDMPDVSDAAAPRHAAPQHPQANLVRAGTSMNAPDTPAGPPLESTPRAPRQRKRKEIDVVDERSERMQKRMVKNRESAARSRQRKQQYTYDLEAQVENLKLQNRQLLEKVIRACAPPPPKIAPTVEGEPLRRTRSGDL